jgi:hypothetical protein
MPRSRLAALAAALAWPVLAGADAAPTQGKRIEDNSFLIEEAYNQEPGVIQHIGTFQRERGGSWSASFTEEWPVLGQTHQASVTLGYASLREAGERGLGDVALNYRWQAVGDEERGVALAPRLSALLPTGDAARGLGAGGAGLQVNLPLSVVLARQVVTHLNVGGTWVPSARALDGRHGPLASFFAGQSLVFLAHPSVNLLVEAIYTQTELAGPGGTEREECLVVNPGLRGAIDLGGGLDGGGLQIVPGVSVPLGVGPSRGERAVFLYLSFEHPCSLAGPTR